MAQALTYAGGIFGVSIYFRTKLGDTESRVKDYFDRRLAKAEETQDSEEKPME